MIILVTGAAGFIGSHLVEALLKDKNSHVIGLDNFNDYYDPYIKKENCSNALKNDRYTLIEGDILDEDLLESLFQKYNVDQVFHLAARAGVRPSIEDPKLYADVNIRGSLNILECARKFSVAKVIMASTSSIYGNNEKVPFSEDDPVNEPISPYAATKRAMELLSYNYHHLYKIPIACIRFFTVYGPRQRPDMAINKFCKLIKEGEKLPVFNNGECERDYTYVDDIVHGVLQVAKHDFNFDIINLGESKTISTLDLIKLIEKNIGKEAVLNLMPSQAGDVDRTYADITKAKTKYGYQPKVSIEEGVRRYV
tara:strand:+ start:1079 stop:2008 length:930 start_codon:yes stop_codon:yes gene_type:complete